MDFPTLEKDQIEVRISTFNDKGATLVLYKDARCDANLLDKVVSPENWQCRFYECKGSLFCSVGIKINDQWIWKDDCGTESNIEKQKGEASDSFKRACFKWGIGRELYTSPFIWIPPDKITNKYDKFYVEKILYDDKNITAISIKNKKTKDRVFIWQADDAS